MNILAKRPRTSAPHTRATRSLPHPQGFRERRPVLVESRTIRGDHRYLAGLAAALRERAGEDAGTPDEVHFADEGDRIHVIVLWRSPTDVREFVESAHRDLLGFHARAGAFPEVERVLWWAAEGGAVTAREAASRADHLREHGPGPRAFTLASPVPAPV